MCLTSKGLRDVPCAVEVQQQLMQFGAITQDQDASYPPTIDDGVT